MREDADLVVKADLRFYFLSLDPANTKIQNKIPKKDPKNRNRACIIHGATYKRVNTVFIGVRSRGRGAVAPPPSQLGRQDFKILVMWSKKITKSVEGAFLMAQRMTGGSNVTTMYPKDAVFFLFFCSFIF